MQKYYSATIDIVPQTWYNNLAVKKGTKEVLQEHAEKHGESVNGFIVRAITETMKRDNDNV